MKTNAFDRPVCGGLPSLSVRTGFRPRGKCAPGEENKRRTRTVVVRFESRPRRLGWTLAYLFFLGTSQPNRKEKSEKKIEFLFILFFFFARNVSFGFLNVETFRFRWLDFFDSMLVASFSFPFYSVVFFYRFLLLLLLFFLSTDRRTRCVRVVPFSSPSAAARRRPSPTKAPRQNSVNNKKKTR